ncbi:MAG: methionyl-tRNA formyltransferase [Actinobacteria bacterium]|nr:methionyl-tRNA formyltransferase [Actinomycetota bacterium]
MNSLAPLPIAGATNVVFFGTPEVAVPHLQALVANDINVELVVTRPDVRRGRGGEISPSPVKIAAQKLGIRVSHEVNDVMTLANETQNLLGVVVAFGELISVEVLSQVPMINVHFSLLPRWRGAAPVERAILTGDSKTGVCIMRVVEKLDEGEIFDRQEVIINGSDDLNSLRIKLNEVAVKMLLRIVKIGFDRGIAQTGEVSYAKKIKTADLLIDWQGTSSQILRQVRVGGAFTYVNGRRLKIVRAHLMSKDSQEFKNGQVCELSKSSCLIASGDGALAIEVVQPEGKSEMSVEEWLRGARLDAKTIFG